MDQEVEQVHRILNALDKEAECLRRGDVDSLLEAVKAIEVHTTALHRLQEPVETSLRGVFEALGRDAEQLTLSQLVEHLPPETRTRMQVYHHMLAELQGRVHRVNEKNKRFIREHVAFFSDLTSAVVTPMAEVPCYPRTGKPRPVSSLPYALNREV
jgi:hypothetical protein